MEIENPKNENPKIQICPTCGNQNFWRSIFGSEFCFECSPPVDFSLVENPDSNFSRSGGENQKSENLNFGQRKFGNPDFGNTPPKNSLPGRPQEIEIQDLQFLPRGVSWPNSVFALWLDSGELVPDWLETRTDILYRIDRRPVGGRGSGRGPSIEETRIPVAWMKPSWVHPDHPDPLMPRPSLQCRWAPNELPCCWWCGLTLFWLDESDNERCAMCSPVPREDWSRVVKWIRKPGVESLEASRKLPFPVGQISLIQELALV